MDMQTLTAFFKYCTIISGCIYLFWALFLFFASDFTYRMQSKWFPISRNSYDTVIHCFLGTFKIFYIMFSITPFLALLIIG